MRAAISIAITACLLAGCSIPPPSGPVGATEVWVLDDPFRPYRQFRTSSVNVRNYPTHYRLTLIGRRDRRTKQTTTFLHVEIAYLAGRRRKYHIARDAQAQPLRITKVSASGNCRGKDECVHDEIFDVAIDAGDLRKAGADGYSLKLFAKIGGEFKATITKAKIAALFARMDNYQPKKSGAVRRKPHSSNGNGGQADRKTRS